MDNSLSFQSDFGDAAHSGRGKGIFEQGEIISPAVNLRRGQERAGDMVGDIAGIDNAFKYVAVGHIFHHTFQSFQHPPGV